MLKFLIKLSIFSLFIFTTFEIAIRIAGRYDDTGQFQIANIKIPPYVIDYENIERTAHLFENPTVNMSEIYDPFTGIAPNPSFERGAYNSQGIRSANYDVVYTPFPDDDVLRIALFGDSNVFGGGSVSYEESWAYVLEQSLISRDIQVEVLNFGVPGYSPAQSQQRWEHVGREFHPDIVIFGGQIFNIKQSTNLYRGFLLPDTPPTLMPVFHLRDDGLQLVNSPVPPPNETVAILQNFEELPLSAYEHHRRDYNILYQSRLFGLLARTFEFNEASFYESDTIHSQTFEASVDYFSDSVLASDAMFIFMHITTDFTLGFRDSNSQLPHQTMLDSISSRHPYIETQQLFPIIEREDWKASHFSPSASIRVGEHVAQYIENCRNDGICVPERNH